MGFFSGVSNFVSSGVDTVQQAATQVRETVLSPVESIPVASSVANLALPGLPDRSINQAQSVFDNASSSNATQRLLLGGPAFSPEIIFNPNYLKGIQSGLAGDTNASKNYFQAAGINQKELLSQSSENKNNAAPIQSIFPVESIGGQAVQSFQSSSPVVKILIFAGLAVGAYYIYKKVRK
jgi:hypothetical protein